MKLTQEEKNQRIAKACGWIVTLATRENPVEKGSFRLPNYFGDPVNAWTHPDKDGVWIKPPNYFNDLNAMHEAEKVLLEREIGSLFRLALHKNSDGPESMFMTVEAAMCHATAAQRAEAFGLTLTLWEAGE